MIFKLKVSAKVLRMLCSTLLERRTANSSSEGKKAKKENKKFLVMKSFRRTSYTRVEDILKIRLTADIELIYHQLTLRYNLIVYYFLLQLQVCIDMIF